MKLACEQVRESLSLWLYGELSLNEEEALESHLAGCAECRSALKTERGWHESLALRAVEPPADLLVKCRQQLRANLPVATPRGGLAMWWDRLQFGVTRSGVNWNWVAKPAMAMGLVALGYWGARIPFSPGTEFTAGAARVRYVESDGAGNIKIVVDETQPRLVSGRADDPQVQRWLLAADRHLPTMLHVVATDPKGYSR